MKNKHYYLLPGGKRAENMKQARIFMEIGKHAFRNAVKCGEVIKVLFNPQTLQSDEQSNNVQ
ncbi:hypothetical protein [Ancylomarina sp. 16SWW S1-10-2]|uniref:hypothetical protein n=1 Tax=Ancylomarina sp. 16SWW S1-10-2 TaxID=2499681 RepID=UPI0012AE5931|nr:hypothetical protein [Ancylomarina sp. 16SWW S1-10-2]MRT91660.1 hypothetical protein [Ancylomarina sp. 16SWW S1-10-2]